jgi:hypothetical protein
MNSLVTQDQWSFVPRLGIDPGKVELTLEDGILTLSGQRTVPEFSKPDEKPPYTRSDRRLGPSCR